MERGDGEEVGSGAAGGTGEKRGYVEMGSMEDFDNKTT
jgi:hypothetical protein